MAKEKHYVFSTRTTEEGLRLLSDLRRERGIGWDDLVIEAVSAHYGLDRAVMALPKREKPAEAGRVEQVDGEHPIEAREERLPEGKPARKGRKAKIKFWGQGGDRRAHKKSPAISDGAGDSDLVAGVGFEPTTFGL